ncbi:unnamed protein product [Meloidogyne enterolobii]|uniref:Uncharacterized protein n=1 Tax=Meloidogyne enterolobii TaxID=390850 RepID=A0ACB0XN32_MELEN
MLVIMKSFLPHHLFMKLMLKNPLLDVHLNQSPKHNKKRLN